MARPGPINEDFPCRHVVADQSFFPIAKLAEHKCAIATARAGNVIGRGDWSTDRLVPDLVNDPQESPWEAVVHEGRGEVQVELVVHGRQPIVRLLALACPAASPAACRVMACAAPRS